MDKESIGPRILGQGILFWKRSENWLCRYGLDANGKSKTAWDKHPKGFLEIEKKSTRFDDLKIVVRLRLPIGERGPRRFCLWHRFSRDQPVSYLQRSPHAIVHTDAIFSSDDDGGN